MLYKVPHTGDLVKIHEYQAKQILSRFGVDVPRGEVALSPKDAIAIAGRLGGRCILKAQIHAGGRGKGGGIGIAADADEAGTIAGRLIGMTLVTPQTGPQGRVVRRLLVEEPLEIDRELYMGITLDRSRGVPVLMSSAEGGVEIEAVAEHNPNAIHKVRIRPLLGLQGYQARAIAFKLGFKGKQVRQATNIMTCLAKLFADTDASLAEINPLVLTQPTDDHPEGQVLAIDAKFNCDDNALFRHKRGADMFDPAEENEAELRAKKFGLSYVALDGTIGCLVNGAGLAMSTMDLIKLHGGEPANFLDVGGGVTAEGAIEAFKIILADKAVKGVLVNIFGGIAKCDVIADALIKAATQIGFAVPVVVRLEGTNVEIARKMLAEANIAQLRPAADLTDAAKQVCASV